MRRIKAKVGARISELVKRAEATCGILIPEPKAIFNLRGEQIAGAAYINHWVVDLNPVIIRLYEDEYIEHTVGHEIAHFVAVAKARSTDIFPHGREWQHVMKCFGLPPRISHDYCLQ